MSHSLQLCGHGASFRLRASDAGLLQHMAARGVMLGWTRDARTAIDVEYVLRRLPPDHLNAMAPSFELECDGVVLRRVGDLHSLLDAFETHAKIEMAYRATDYLFVHAGVVGWRGCAILIPGRSGAGKTTLVKALVDSGAEYYSDEFAVLDRDGRVRPYNIPLSIRARGGQPAMKARVESLGGRAGVSALPVALIVVTRYQHGARWRPRLLSCGEALLALMDNTVAATRPPECTMPILRQAVLEARAIQSPRGDARGVTRSLLAELT